MADGGCGKGKEGYWWAGMKSGEWVGGEVVVVGGWSGRCGRRGESRAAGERKCTGWKRVVVEKGEEKVWVEGGTGVVGG